jgi:hypothetical protein
MLFALVILFTFASCTLNKSQVELLMGDPNAIADNTFSNIVDAINNRNATAIRRIFSVFACRESDLTNEQAEAFLHFIEGEIVTYSSASEAGVIVHNKYEFGKERKVIQSSFRLETTEQTYYIAIIECPKDTFDRDNSGVTSVYIINAKDWEEDYIFRGEKVKTPGIHILE